jgi:hypothetical protein
MPINEEINEDETERGIFVRIIQMDCFVHQNGW